MAQVASQLRVGGPCPVCPSKLLQPKPWLLSAPGWAFGDPAGKAGLISGTHNWQWRWETATRFPTLQAPGMALCSPAGNGYVSARASPNLLPVSNGSSLGKAIPAKSPPPPPQHSNPLVSNLRKPDLRVITSQGGKGLMQHLTDDQLDLTHGVSSHTFFDHAGRFGGHTQPADPGAALLSDAHGIQPSSPTSLSLGSLSAWQPQPQQLQQAQQIPVSLSNLIQGSHLPHAAAASLSAATLTVNTSPSISIKSEPVSPSRERSSGTPLSSSFPHQARHEPSRRSPVDSLSSNASSYEGPPEREDPSRPDFGSSFGLLRPSTEAEGENASIKRMRLDAWAT
ncbi:hypothetical protein E2320_013690 [Naja naja]|nr:hypothetical protein E2320_013690 [Naja naja]